MPDAAALSSQEEKSPLIFMVSGEADTLSGFLNKLPDVRVLLNPEEEPVVPYIHTFVLGNSQLKFPGSWFAPFERLSPLLSNKVVVMNSARKPGKSLLSFFNEIGIERVFAGPARAQYLKQYIFTCLKEKEMVGSSHYYRSEIFKSLQEKNPDKVISLLQNFCFSFSSRVTDKVISAVYSELGMLKPLKTHLRKILRGDPGRFWAARQLAEVYQQEKNEDYETDILEKMCANNMLNPGRVKRLATLRLKQMRYGLTCEICEAACKTLDPAEQHFFTNLVKKSDMSRKKYSHLLSLYHEHDEQDQYTPDFSKNKTPEAYEYPDEPEDESTEDNVVIEMEDGDIEIEIE